MDPEAPGILRVMGWRTAAGRRGARRAHRPDSDSDPGSDPDPDGPTVPPPTELGELCTLPSQVPIERYFSAEYEMSCAGCHGRWGEGYAADGIPALPGSVQDYESYAAIVRAGRVEREDMYMPAFSAHSISDDALRADWEQMQARPAGERAAAATEQPGPQFAPPVAAESLDASLDAGLVAWRTMGHEGNCQGCHGPGFDLARFRFRDSDILRRCAGQHLDSATCTAIVDRVHAMRATFDTAGMCDPRAPFLQPGHEVLEGDDPVARDLALIDELESHGIHLASEWVMSSDDAIAVIEAIANAGFINIRVGYPMNTWTRDVFNDGADFSSAEWIPAYPRTALPEQQQAWDELLDRYIDEPSAPDPVGDHRSDRGADHQRPALRRSARARRLRAGLHVEALPAGLRGLRLRLRRCRLRARARRELHPRPGLLAGAAQGRRRDLRGVERRV